MRYQNELVRWGLADDAAVYGPEPSENAEQRRFPAAVGPDNEQVLLYARKSTATTISERWTHTRLDIEAEALDKDVTVGGNNGDVLELNLIRQVHHAAAFQN